MPVNTSACTESHKGLQRKSAEAQPRFLWLAALPTLDLKYHRDCSNVPGKQILSRSLLKIDLLSSMHRETRTCFLQQTEVSLFYILYFAKWTIYIHSLMELFYSTGKYDSHTNSKEACTITVLRNTFSRTMLTIKKKIYHCLTN